MPATPDTTTERQDALAELTAAVNRAAVAAAIARQIAEG